MECSINVMGFDLRVGTCSMIEHFPQFHLSHHDNKNPPIRCQKSQKNNVSEKEMFMCRAEWETGAMFVTPPGWWHSHHNESKEEAWVLPVQDAGLYTHQRTLDIRFAEEEIRLHEEGKMK